MKTFIDVPIKDSHRLLNAGNVVLVSAQKGHQKTITSVAWQMPVSGSPKLVAIALAHKRFCLELIKKSNCFCINIPDANLIDAINYCGSHSGRDVDKCENAKLTAIKCATIDSFYINECVGYIECTAYKLVEAGDHTIVIGEVKSASALPDLLTDDRVFDTHKYQIINHLGSDYFAILKLSKRLAK